MRGNRPAVEAGREREERSAVIGSAEEQGQRVAAGAGLGIGISRLPGPDVARHSLRNLGSFGTLALDALRSLLTQRPIWMREATIQSIFILRSVMRPALAVNALFALSIIGLAAGVPLEQLGASDRNAAFLGVGLIREFGPVMTAAVFAGVIGTTYTAELGARKIREELDALRCLGIDPVRAIVVPRIVA